MAREILIGGKGDYRPDSDFDPRELAIGIREEMEHTDDPAAAKEIAKDHLSQDKLYYRKLKRIEKCGMRLVVTPKALRKAGGPYIGPKGGKWANPEHTIPWHEPSAGHDVPHQVGDTHQIRYNPKIFGGQRPDDTFHVVAVKDGKVQLSRHPSGGYGPWMDAASVKHFKNDLAGKVDAPHTGRPEIDAVIDGKAELLGKGDDGLAFRVGNTVIKVSTTVPYQPENPGHRSPQQAVDMLRRQVETANRLAGMGISGIQRSEFVQVGDKGFQIKPWVEIPPKFTQQQLDAIQAIVVDMHKHGFALNDDVQAGLDEHDHPVLFDVGKASPLEPGTGIFSNERADHDRIKALYRANGGDYVRQGLSEGQEAWEETIKRIASKDKPPTALTAGMLRRHLETAAEQLRHEARVRHKGDDRKLSEAVESIDFDLEDELRSLEHRIPKPSPAALQKAGGPYIGPRGGKWADPQHTQHWEQQTLRLTVTPKGVEEVERHAAAPPTAETGPSPQPPRAAAPDAPKTRKVRETLVPPPGVLTSGYLHALQRTFERILAEPADTLGQLHAKLETVHRFAKRLRDDLMFTRGLWRRVGAPKDEHSAGSAKSIVLAAKLQTRLDTLIQQTSESAYYASEQRDWTSRVRSPQAIPADRKLYDTLVAEHGSGSEQQWERSAVAQLQGEASKLALPLFRQVVRDAMAIKQHREKTSPPALHRESFLRQFKLGDLTVAFNDQPSRLPANISDAAREALRPPHAEDDVVRGLTLAKRALERRGLSQLWQGALEIRPEGERTNPYDTAERSFGVGADYNPVRDHVRLYDVASWADRASMARLVIHELGHRYWFKRLSPADRSKFTAQFGHVAATSEYGAINPAEDFAEVFADYVMGTKDLSRDQIDRFKTYLGKSLGARKRPRDAIMTLTFRGLTVRIEHQQGTARQWYNAHNGKHGETVFAVPYGYVPHTEGTDGDELDVFVGPDESAAYVYLINTRKAPDFRTLDEQKAMIGFGTEAEARACYLAHYDDPRFLGSVITMPWETFVRRIREGAVDGKQLRKATAVQSFGGVLGAIVNPRCLAIGVMGMQGDPARRPAGAWTVKVTDEHPGSPAARAKRSKGRKRRKSIEQRERLDSAAAAMLPAHGNSRPLADISFAQRDTDRQAGPHMKAALQQQTSRTLRHVLHREKLR